MFVDKAKIFIKGGDGGDGIVSYRREAHVPLGGPAGGDGGKGADVIFRVDEGLRTLMDFRYQKHFKAPRGEKGKTKNMHGANAEDMIVRVPPGTIVVDDDTNEILADMTVHGQEVVIAKGGRGGRGNSRFATPANSAPDIAEKGEEGVERWVVLELKVMADVGLVGFPSVGKSTLLSIVSAARPKIASYHFTTLTPNLGVVDVEEGRSFVMADLPGLIEGAHEGVGLGHEFLRHIERTRIIVHVIDMSAADGRDPYEDYVKINEELKLYNVKLEDRPQLIAANKMDVAEAEVNLKDFREKLADSGVERRIYPISAVTKRGVQELLYAVADLLETIPVAPPVEELATLAERKIYRLEQDDDDSFIVRRENDTFIVEGAAVERLAKRTDFNRYDSAVRFANILRKMGVDKELRKRGAADGQTIRIGELEFEFSDKD